MDLELNPGQISNDFISQYLSYIGVSEAPTVFHRWSALSVLGAWLGRRYWYPFGDANINCNLYAMLMGDAGSRKSTAIKRAVKLVRLAGYDTIAADKTSKEKFLLDLAGEPDFQELETNADMLDANLFGADKDSKEDKEILIAADEFNIFMGNGNIEFLALLGTLWDYEGEFQNKVKNSKSPKIWNPTVSMIAGNTATSFSLAFPPEAIGQGIFSRMLLIYGERTGTRITFPKRPESSITQELIAHLHLVKAEVTGEATQTQGAEKLLDKIYQTHGGINDVRFESYNNRRFTHLLKLCLLVSASNVSSQITESHVLYANTILTHAEHSMPKALGEFGKARHSDVSHKIIALLETSSSPIVSIKEIWQHVHNDLENPDAMKELLFNLSYADKIMAVKGGYISKQKVLNKESDTVDWNLLTETERSILF